MPKEIIDKAVKYIHKCIGPDGGVAYNSHGGRRPSADHRGRHCLPVQCGRIRRKEGDKQVRGLRRLCTTASRTSLIGNNQKFGHWHYAHYYYSQVLYREGGKKWADYRKEIFPRLIHEANADGYWEQGFMGRSLHHRYESHDPATGSRHVAYLPTLRKEHLAFDVPAFFHNPTGTQTKYDFRDHPRIPPPSRNSTRPAARSWTSWPR